MMRQQEKGQALILSYLVVSVFIVIAAALSSKSVSERSMALRSRLEAEAFYLAEGGTESAIASFTSAIANYNINASVETFNATANYTALGGLVVNSTVTRLDVPGEQTITEGQTKIKVRNYEVVSTAVHPQNPAIRVTVHQIIARRLIPTFQHSVFYDKDLEVLPGANMTLSGRIHCNQDMYLDAETNKLLSINSTYVHSAGNIYNRRKNNGAQLGGEVEILVDKPGAPDYEDMDNLDSEDANWTTAAVERWNGTVQSSVHGVIKITAPSVASIQPDGYYASQADVVVNSTGIYKGGAPLVPGVNCPAGTFSVNETLYNNREGTYVRTVNINISKLANLDNERPSPSSPPYANNLPSNGLIYATCNDAGSDRQPGVRLVGGSKIARNGGLTVVSNDPVYIQGNFNTIDEQPASVICDSLNLLSNAWNDSNSTAARWSSRNANQTTFNCAFIAGIDETHDGLYNGGLENYPRLHENWSNVELKIKGSFVAIWNSVIADGQWAYGSPYYTAPKRNWSYNSAFNDVTKLPPYTPWAVEARRIAWWKE